MRDLSISSRAPARRNLPTRRKAGGRSSGMAVDMRYRHAMKRRRDNVDADALWPEWLIPATVSSLIISLTAYHHSALLGFVGSFF